MTSSTPLDLSTDPTTGDHACPLCQIGVCRAETVTYAHFYGGQLVSVPHMLRFTCDVCGFQEFDQKAVRSLHRMLGYRWPQQSTDKPRHNGAPVPLDADLPPGKRSPVKP